MSLHEVISIIKKLSDAGVKHIQLLGGEPIYRKDFFEILRFIENTEIKVGINTNGVLLTKSNVNELLSLSCIDMIIVSIDGLNDTHNKIRGANIYTKVIDNIDYLVKRRRELRHGLIIGVNTVITKDNFSELDELIRKLDSVGIDEWIGLELIKQEAKSFIHEFTYDETIDILRKLGEIKKTVTCRIVPKLCFPLLVDYVNKRFGFKLDLPLHGCGAGLTFAYIDWKGFFYPCDRFIENFYTENSYKEKNLEKINLITKNPIDAITSPLFKEFNFAYIEPMINKSYDCCKCAFYQRECYPCIALKHFFNNVSSPLDCETLFKIELNRVADAINRDFSIKKKVALNTYITLNSNNNMMYIFNHDNNQIYRLDDQPHIGMIEELLKQKSPVKMHDLILSWLKNISATKSFVNNHETDEIIQSFLDIITDFINQDIVRDEDDE
jgi:MoaA/NifB/PqqE/SkfB family radical SAM enzyme